MSKIFSRWIVLLFLLETSTAQFSNCDYIHDITFDREIYFIASPGYPLQNYPAGFRCRWNVRSEISFNMICNIEWIPTSSGCSTEALSIQLGFYAPHRYCGYQSVINVTSSPGIHGMVVTLTSSTSNRGGKFLCTVKSFDHAGIYKECGRHNSENHWNNRVLNIQSRIMGGIEAEVNEYPMMAGIIDVQNQRLFCGATIINNYQLLTAAHCVAGKTNDKLLIRVGDHDLSTNTETRAVRQFRIRKIEIHQDYSSRDFNDDIAIITIDGIIEFNKFVGAACLPFRKFEEKFEGQVVEIMGWGTTDFSGPMSDILLKSKVQIMTRKDQLPEFPKIGTRQIGTLMNGTDSCQSDSGGPIFYRNPRTNRLVLIGIISHGGICGNGKPGINTRVGAYINWIMERNYRNFHYCKEE